MTQGSGKRKTTGRKWLTALLVTLAVFFVVLPAGNAAGYELIFRFGFHDATGSVPELPGVRETVFTDDRGQELHGFFYGDELADPKGIVVFAHGISSNHLAYESLFERLLEENFRVFAFDVKGYGKSGTEGSGGLPEGVRSYRAALSVAGAEAERAGIKLIAAGHSFGAYSAGAALEEGANVDRAVLLAPFDESSAMLKQGAERYSGPFVYLLLPYVKLYEAVKFGTLADATATRGLKASGVPALVVFGTYDETIRPAYGRDVFEAAFPDSDTVRIVTLNAAHELNEAMIEAMISFLNE